LHLACGHSCSIMAIYGIIYNGESNDTESIRCPFCRANLIPKIVSAMSKEDYDSKNLKYYTKDDITTNDTFGNNDFQFERIIPISDDDIPIKVNPEQDAYIDSMFNRDVNYKSDGEDDNDSNSGNQDVFNQLSNYLYEQIVGHT